MPKDVKFNIKLNIDGKEQIVTASTNVKDLANQLGIAKTKGEALRDALVISTQITQGISNLTSGLQQLTGIMQQYTQAAAVQEQAEVQVATVMRQRMNATDEEIQSIKDLASAQQALGIIGDEVQLAGVQQIATFLNEKSSIEALLPAMNDLLAQQHGYNVSSQDAVAVANLMGKVMQGQTSALKRVGITFTAAQEQILKFGDESQRAATLAQVITDNVGHMNSELAKTDAGKAKQLSNTIGDIKEQVGALFSSVEPAIVAVAELGLAMNAVGTTVTAIRTVTIAIRNLGLVTRLTSAVQAAFTAVTTASGTASAGAAVGVTALGVAIRGLMIATGVGAVIAALTLIIGALTSGSHDAAVEQESLAKQMEQAKAVTEAGNRAYTDAAASLQINIARTKNFNGTKEQEKKLVAELNSTYGATMGYFSSVSAWYNALTANSKTYCRQMVIEARTRMLANQVAVEMQTQKDIKFDKDGNLKTYDTSKGHRLTWGGAGGSSITGAGGGLQLVETDSEHDIAVKQLNASRNRQKNLEREMEGLFKESASLVMPVKGAPVAPTGITPPKATGRGGGGNTGNTGTDKPEPLQGSIDYYQKELDELRKKIYAAADEATAKTLQATYEEKEAQLKELKIRIGLEEPKTEEAKTYMEQLQERLNEAKKTFDNATTVEARVQADAQVQAIQAEINEATYGRVSIPAAVEPSYIQKGSTADLRASYDNAQGRANRVQQDFEIGIIGKEEAERQLADINAQLAELGLNPIEIKLDDTEIKSTFDTIRDGYGSIRNIGDGIHSMTDVLKGNGDAWQKATATVSAALQVYEGVMSVIELMRTFGIISTAASSQAAAAKTKEAAATTAVTTAAVAQAAAAPEQILAETAVTAAAKLAAQAQLQLAAAGYAAAHANIPFVGFGLAAGFTAAAQALVQAMGAIPLASGGVISGPTLAYVGEYSGASHNPEVVAPLDKLRSMIQPSGGVGGNVRFEIEGRKLVGVISNETQVSGKSGRRNKF